MASSGIGACLSALKFNHVVNNVEVAFLNVIPIFDAHGVERIVKFNYSP